MLLCLPHLRSGHHLHRLRDLRGVPDRFDPPPYVLRVRHLNYCQAVLNSSIALLSCDSSSSSSCFFSRIARSKGSLRVSSQSWSFNWNSFTRSTGTASMYPFCIAHMIDTCSST